MEVYSYAHDSGEYIGVTQADVNPEWVEGMPLWEQYLHPAFTTLTCPPSDKPGFAVIHSDEVGGAEWYYAEDHRGETWYKDGVAVVIEELGPVEAGLANTPPPVVVPPITVNARQIRQALTKMNLRTSVEAYVTAATIDVKDWWSYSPVFERDNPMIVAAATALGQSSAALDQLFELAETL